MGTTPIGEQIHATSIADRATGNELKPNADGSLNVASDGGGTPQLMKVDGARNLFIAPIQLATPLVAANTLGAAGAAASAVLPTVGFATTYISGFIITSSPSTAVVTGLVTVGVLINGVTYQFEFVENTTQGGFLKVDFPYALPANGVNTVITVSVPAITNGGIVAINAYGFR